MTTPIKVTFDSNVWENLFDSNWSNFELRKHILTNKIEPYFTQISLSIESIERDRRKDFFESYEPHFESKVVGSSGNGAHVRVCMQPDASAHYGLHPKMKSKLEFAKELNFRVLPMTNIGTVRSSEIPESMIVSFKSSELFWEYADKLGECSDYIQSLRCGSFQYLEYKQMCLSHDVKLNEVTHKKFSESVAEWADGDSLAAHYAYGNSIFCTEDNAKNSGKKSVFNKCNLSLVINKFDIRVMSIKELLSYIQQN